MQKLEERNTYKPTNTSLVCSDFDLSLTRDQSLSVADLKTSFNNPEENQRLPVSGHKVNTLVYVLNKDGSPLMPCKPAKARHLLKQRRAKVISYRPFIIQLLWDCENNIQEITLGIDAGYSRIGFSAVINKKELISGEVKLRDDISKKLLERKMYRRGRRNKLWYRKPRFMNRTSIKKEGWLAPSIQHKLDSHIRLVEKIKKILSISKIIVEIASFDIAKIKSPEIQGKEYQEGNQLGFYNLREYILHRDNHLCQHCKSKTKDKVLQLHHIRGRMENQATDRPEELMTVCKICHTDHHKGINIIPTKEIKGFKPETFMSTIRWKLVNILSCEWTYGYITKYNRIQLELEKSHTNDAFVIAGGNGQIRSFIYNINQIRRNNRCLQLNRKGFNPAIRKQRYTLQPHDLVRYDNKILQIKGCHCFGKRVVLENKKSVKTSDIQLYKYGGGWQFLPALKDGVSLPICL